ncbi:NCS2 family permease [bacterium]|nr:NCS2 family permease [candidate division CSSED10-310 bacterium]
MERIFQLKAHGTTVRTEIIAGITTFLTMSYIIVVNPGILSNAGIPVGPSTVATILASAVGCLMMAFYANRPFAIAPYMGENAFIAFTVVLGMNASWQAGITAVFIGGILFVLITAFRLRVWLANAVPKNLKFSFVVGIGLFLTLIGLMDTGIVLKHPAPDVPLTIGNLLAPESMLAIAAFILMAVLIIRKVTGAIMIGILGTTACAFILKLLDTGPVPFLPTVSLPTGFFSLPPSIAPIFMQFRFAEVMSAAFLPVFLTIFIMDFVDTMGTVIGVSARAGLLDENGNLPQIERPMMADAVATVTGACFGTTTTGTFIESAAGIEEGGRTGLTALTTGLLFLLALFFTPLLTAIPTCAYGPALIIVGVLMMDSVRRIDFSDLTELIPAFVVIVLMSFTYNIGIGCTAGFVTYPAIKVLAGRGREVGAGTWVLAVVSLLMFIVYPYA